MCISDRMGIEDVMCLTVHQKGTGWTTATWCHFDLVSVYPKRILLVYLNSQDSQLSRVSIDISTKTVPEEEMSGWHHWFDGRESEWTPGVGDGQGGLACCDSWVHRKSDTTEWLNWTELKVYDYSFSCSGQYKDCVFNEYMFINPRDDLLY